MVKLRTAGFLATLCLGVMPAANAATINFKALADAPVTAGELGESAWSPLNITISPGFTMTITGKDTGANAYAYLDSGNAGLGVCKDLIAGAPANTPRPGLGSNLCSPSSNDNVKSGESLEFVFNQAAVITNIWFNNNHDTDFQLLGDKIKIGVAPTPASHTFLAGMASGPLVNGNTDWLAAGPYNVAAGAVFTMVWETDQFYVSKMEVSAVPEPASALLVGVGLFGVALLRRRLNGDLS